MYDKRKGEISKKREKEKRNERKGKQNRLSVICPVIYCLRYKVMVNNKPYCWKITPSGCMPMGIYINNEDYLKHFHAIQNALRLRLEHNNNNHSSHVTERVKSSYALLKECFVNLMCFWCNV